MGPRHAAGRARPLSLHGVPAALRDRRYLVVAEEVGRLVLGDSVTGTTTALVALEGERVGPHFALSRDERWIDFDVEREDADVWLRELR